MTLPTRATNTRMFNGGRRIVHALVLVTALCAVSSMHAQNQGNVTFNTDANFKTGVPIYSLTAFPGASPSQGNQKTTATCTSGSTSVTLAGAIDFQNGQGIALQGCGPSETTLLAPTGLSATPSTTTTTAGTTAASVTGNVATLTITGHPLVYGLTTGSTVTVAGFSGGDTYFNGTFTLTATSQSATTPPFTVSYALTHANASATSNGTVTQTATTSYSYKFQSRDGFGGLSPASAVTTTTTGAAVLGSGTANFVNVCMTYPTPAISAVSRTGNVVTVTTSAAHQVFQGDGVSLVGVTDTSYVGSFVVASVVDSTHFTFNQTGANSSSSGGTIYDLNSPVDFPVFRNYSGTYTFIGMAQRPYGNQTQVCFPDYGEFLGSTPGIANNPSVAVPQWLITTITTGAGTTSIQTVAAAANSNGPGIVAQHDNTLAMNAGFQAIKGSCSSEGGALVLPTNYSYNMFQLNYPTLSLPGCGAGADLDIILEGELSPMVPFQLPEWYSLHGRNGYKAGNLQGKNFSSANVNPNGLAPVIRICNEAGIHTVLENIGLPYALGDGILIDCNDNTNFRVMLNHVYVQGDGHEWGAPIRANSVFQLVFNDVSPLNGGLIEGALLPRNGGYGLITDCMTLINQGSGTCTQPVSQFSWTLGFMAGGGILNKWEAASGGPTGEGWDINDIYTESQVTPFITHDASHAAGLESVTLRLITPADCINNYLLGEFGCAGFRVINGNANSVRGVHMSAAGFSQLCATNSICITGPTVEANGVGTDFAVGSAPYAGVLHNAFRWQVSGQQYFTADAAANGFWGILMPPPYSLGATPAAGAGLTANQTYYYCATATDAGVGNGGESYCSNENSATPSGSNLQVSLSWGLQSTTMATNIKVYRGTATSQENRLIATLAGNATSYTDTGTAGSAVVPPTYGSAFASILQVPLNPAASFNKAWFNPPSPFCFGCSDENPTHPWEFGTGIFLRTPVQGINNVAAASNTMGVPLIVGWASQNAKTTAQAATTLFTVGATSTLFRFSGTVQCTTASAAATVTVAVLFTDTSGTAQTITSGTGTCTTLNANSINSLNQVFEAKNGTNIQYQTTIANTPTYDVRVAVEQLGTN